MNDDGSRRLSTFVRARIEETTDPDHAEALLELWNMAHDQIILTPHPTKPQCVPGEVRNLRAVKELARRWRDHPQYWTEWDR